MWNPSYLLATLDQLNDYLEIQDARFNSDSQTFDCKVSYSNGQLKLMSVTIPIPAGWFTQNLNYDWQELVNRVNGYQSLVGINKANSLEECACLYFLYQNILEEQISHAEFVGDWAVEYTLNNKSYTYYACDKDIALAADLVLKGYTLCDHQGSHYTVKTPRSLEHLTSAYSCSCDEFQTSRQCSHIPFAKEVVKHRQAMLKLGVITIV